MSDPKVKECTQLESARLGRRQEAFQITLKTNTNICQPNSSSRGYGNVHINL
jgi:hypothetical protein